MNSNQDRLVHKADSRLSSRYHGRLLYNPTGPCLSPETTVLGSRRVGARGRPEIENAGRRSTTLQRYLHSFSERHNVYSFDSEYHPFVFPFSERVTVSRTFVPG